MSIYTKKGDRGETGLYDKNDPRAKRLSKSDLRIEIIGTLDELNSFVGLTASVLNDKKLAKVLEEVQKNLLTIGSILAGSSLRFSKKKSLNLEKQIDEMDKTLPPLKNFILPGGTKTSAHLQYCRSLARKAERRIVILKESKEIKPQILIYINRLSDYFFTLAREVNRKAQLPEKVWKR